MYSLYHHQVMKNNQITNYTTTKPETKSPNVNKIGGSGGESKVKNKGGKIPESSELVRPPSASSSPGSRSYGSSTEDASGNVTQNIEKGILFVLTLMTRFICQT